MKATRLLAAGLSLAACVAFPSAGFANEPGGRSLSTILSGAFEIPGPADPDGSGEATITLNNRMLVCFQLTAADIGVATAAHIHEGLDTEAGPIVVPLTPPADGFSSGCVSLDPDEIEEIRQHPELYYIDVHTEDFPAGAVRGQLPN